MLEYADGHGHVFVCDGFDAVHGGFSSENGYKALLGRIMHAIRLHFRFRILAPIVPPYTKNPPYTIGQKDILRLPEVRDNATMAFNLGGKNKRLNTVLCILQQCLIAH